ncbi:unnamed protein product [Microthlaspi erraticum]|uniref:Uncharacterized protein n=1 Tax=Microthlaspi erraticum TaxID=1685480 RepID=A0A6D2JYP2_9BRAS|nr:unnamed protein product [Microthlaspi erraticum]
MAELTYRPGKHRSVVDPSKTRHHKPRTTAPREPGGMDSRPCSTSSVPHTSVPSDQEGIVPRPAKNIRPKPFVWPNPTTERQIPRPRSTRSCQWPIII